MKTAKRIMWGSAFLSLVGTAAMMPLMPDRVPMHYNASWEIDRWGSKYENLIFPLMNIGMALFFAALASYYERKSKENAEDKESVQAASNAKVMWIAGAAVSLLFTAMQGVILYEAYRGAALGGTAQAGDISRVTFLLSGALYIVLGNYMPKTRRNGTVGMRVLWSMYNDNTWRKCNRFGGIVMMLTGVATMVTALLAETLATVFLMLVYLATAVAVMLVYAYRVYRAEIRSGEKADE